MILEKNTINKGGYIFNKLNNVIYSANKVRGVDNKELNEKTIESLKKQFDDSISFFDNKSIFETYKDYKFEIEKNKVKLSGNVPYKYYEKMQESYDNQLNKFSNDLDFISPCKEKILETCSFTILEK